MGNDVRELLDNLTHAIAAFETVTINPDDAPDIARRLRAANSRLWAWINAVEAMIRIDIKEVAREVENVGFGKLFEAGVLRVDSRAWRKWRNG